MNKNLFKTFAIAAMAVLAGACAKEQVASGDGETVEMTFNVDVPETAITTKGLSDAAQVDELKFQLFIKDGDGYKMVQEQIVPVADKKAVVKATLVKQQTYSAAFWAQTSGTDFYETTDLRAVKMNIAKVKANEPTMDAFWGNDLVIKAAPGMKPRTVKLLRALAQVNLGTVVPTGADALSITKSQIVMKGVPTTLNVLLGNKNNSHSGSEDITFQDNAPIIREKLTVGEAAYDYVATAYVFAPNDDKMLTDIATKVTFSNGKYTTITTPNVPIRRNFRTNILGNLFNVDATWNVNIDEKFTGDITYDEIEGKLLAGKNVTLTTDYSVAKNSKGVVAKSVDNTFAVLDLNGHKFENSNSVMDNKAALQVHGNLRIVGDGKVLCNGDGDNNAVIVENGAHLIIEGGYYYVNKDKNGKSNATVFISPNGYPGKKSLVEIKGGTFEAEVGTNGTPFVLNQDDAVKEICFKVYGGTFIGFNPADNNADGEHTNYVAEGYRAVEITYEGKQAWKVEAIPAVTTQDGLNAAIADVAEGETVTVYLEAGEYDLIKKDCKGEIVVKGKDKATTIVRVPNESRGYDNKSISFENLTFNCVTEFIDDARESQFPRTDVHFTNCNINGLFAAVGSTTTSFKECTFTASDYAIKYYGGPEASKLIVEKCQFNTCGKGILMFNEAANTYAAEVVNCTFTASATISGKAAVQMHTETGIKGNLSIVGSTATGFDSSINGGLWNEFDNTAKVHTTNFNVAVDGTPVQTAK